VADKLLKGEKKSEPDMNQRIKNAFHRTWQYIAADALALEGHRMSKKDMAWMCADYIDRDGKDAEAVKAFDKMTEKERDKLIEEIAKDL